MFSSPFFVTLLKFWEEKSAQNYEEEKYILKEKILWPKYYNRITLLW